MDVTYNPGVCQGYEGGRGGIKLKWSVTQKVKQDNKKNVKDGL